MGVETDNIRNSYFVLGFFFGVAVFGIILLVFNGGVMLGGEEVAKRVCVSHDAELLKFEGNVDRVLCIKDSRIIEFDNLWKPGSQ